MKVTDAGLTFTPRETAQLRRAQALLDRARERLNDAGIGDEEDGVNAGACAVFLDELLASVDANGAEDFLDELLASVDANGAEDAVPL